jgi:predicted O-methyltransferase YrrM
MFSSLLQSIIAVPLTPLGRHRLAELSASGAPDYLTASMQFLLGGPVSQPDRQAIEQVEAIRSKFLDRLEVERSLGTPRELNGKQLKIDPSSVESQKLISGWTARISSVREYWGAFLYLLASACRAKLILELGSCIGISGAYLSSGKACERFITIEQSALLASLAETNIRQVARNVRVWNASFDDALDQILPSLDRKLDMVYIDGHHEKAPTLHYMDRVIPYSNEGCLIVFDDIHWTRGMVEAWQTITQKPGLSYTIDLGRFGLCVRSSQNVISKNFDLSLYTRWWQSGIAAFPGKA